MISKEVTQIITKRRSIFPHQFNGKKINKKSIQQLLKNANTAPTHRLTQPWFFKVFSDDSKINLAKELINQQKNYSEIFEKKIISKFTSSSHIICICMRRDDSKSIPEWEEIAATAMAVQNIWISCVNSEIGGYWSTPKEIDKLSVFLKLKSNEHCLGLFYLGLYDSIAERIINRKRIEEDTEWFN